MSERESKGEIALNEKKSWTVSDYIVFAIVVAMIARGHVEAGILLVTQWFPDLRNWMRRRPQVR